MVTTIVPGGPAPVYINARSAPRSRNKGMATQSWLLRVSVIVEQAEELAAQVGPGWRTDDELQEVITAALTQFLARRPDIRVEWESMTSIPLDDNPGVGRCAVCNRWVVDVENRNEFSPSLLCRGAVVGGQLLCDEDLPEDHPIAF